MPQTPSPAAPFLSIFRRPRLRAAAVLGILLTTGGCAGTALPPSPAPAPDLPALELFPQAHAAPVNPRPPDPPRSAVRLREHG